MKIGIIGAGLAGLTAAYELRDTADVTIFEADGRIGGKLHTVAFSDGPTDMGAEAFLNARVDARDFFHQLGLDTVYPSSASPLIYSGGHTHPMPTANTIMGIPATSDAVAGLISDATAHNIDTETTRPGIDWEIGQDISVGELVAARYGSDLVHHVLDALLGGVYSCTATDLGLRATIPALAGALDAQAKQGHPVHLSTAVTAALNARPTRDAGTPIFATFPGGYAELYETLAEKSGADIYIDDFITTIRREADGFHIGEHTFDKILLATPAPTTALLVREHCPEAAEELSRIQLATSCVVGMKFADGTGLPEASGILVATDSDDVTAKAFTISSNKWPHLKARGGALVRASFGRLGDDQIARADEDTLVDQALDDLKTITGFDGRATDITDIYVQRWYGGLPRYDHEHIARVQRIEKALAACDGIDATGAWAHGVGVPDVIASARAAAARLATT